jgi:spore maturation protein CgeB
MRLKCVFKIVAVVLLIIGMCYGFIRFMDHRTILVAEQIPNDHWDKQFENNSVKKQYNIALLSEEGGEWQYSYYLQEAAKNMGWEARTYYKSFVGREDELRNFKPDMIVVTSVGYELFISPEFKDVKRYMFYTIAPEKPFHFNSVYLGKLRTKYMKKLAMYNGYLITPSAVDVFKNAVEGFGKDFYGIQANPTVYNFGKNYVGANKIFYGSFNADKLRKSQKYKDMLKILISENIIDLYGPKGAWAGFEKNWKGMVDTDKLLSTMHSHGVTLVLHSKDHLRGGIPSGRIFEAASANTVIISDRNKFVEDNFGDSVLYVDISKSGEEMAKQISDHYNWIKNNPHEAKVLADKANKIFREKFSLERDLIRIAKMHEGIIHDEKN